MRNPFLHYVNELIASYKGVYADSTLDALHRRLKQQNRTFQELKDQGAVKTTDPKRISIDDVKAFYMCIKARGLSNGTVSHELGSLHALCMYANGNNAVERFKYRYPQARSKKRRGRLPGFSPGMRDKIIVTAMSVRHGDYHRMRAYALVVLSCSAGLRVIELRNAKFSHLDLTNGTIYLDVVKGGDLYGEPRTCPILPDALPFLSRFVEERSRYLASSDLVTDVLFPSHTGTSLSGQTLRREKDIVAVECGITLDYRMCRRTYAQALIDMGVPYDAVALVMGHATTSMTEKNYARKTLEDALSEVSEAVVFKGGLKN